VTARHRHRPQRPLPQRQPGAYRVRPSTLGWLLVTHPWIGLAVIAGIAFLGAAGWHFLWAVTA
jgi:hypothetical protein